MLDAKFTGKILDSLHSINVSISALSAETCCWSRITFFLVVLGSFLTCQLMLDEQPWADLCLMNTSIQHLQFKVV
uniref:Uncharacterized protein n=1 Tax=Arundo donax TaxID=35708 RepID=A0A0A9AMJ3_ARUDO